MRFDLLTAREVEIAELITDGFTVREIAARLNISPNTVSTYMVSIYTKFGAKPRSSKAFIAKIVTENRNREEKQRLYRQLEVLRMQNRRLIERLERRS